MGGLAEFQMLQLNRKTIGDHDQAAGDATAHGFFQRCCHGARRLPHRENDQTRTRGKQSAGHFDAIAIAVHRVSHGSSGIDGPKSRGKQRLQ
jgi:hypothetical protein